MAGTVIDGNKLAEELSEHVHGELRQLKVSGARPGLATILVGDDHAAAAYERHVRRLAERLGCEYANEHLPDDAEVADVLAVVGKLNADPRVTGILVLRPLPAGISEPLVYRALDPYKDVEAVHPENAGLLAQGRPRFVPSTPASCFYLLDSYLRSTGREPEAFYPGKTLVVVGRSDSVGKPAASLGLQRHATVVTCHSRTTDLAAFTRQADILVVAAGVAGLVTGDMVREGVIAVDVGIDPVKDPETGKVRFVGDIEFESVAAKAEAITPVPGGVGPITDVWLIGNAVSAAAAGSRLRPIEGLGRGLVIVLGIGMVGDLANILVTFLEMRILERYREGEAISDADVTEALDRSGFVGLVIVVLFLVSGVLWLVWQHRGHANLHAAGVDRLRFTPGWAVGWWFVPFANLVKPFQTVRELWKASDGSPRWWETKTWPVIGWWWAGYLLFNVLDGVASAYFADRSATLDSLITGDKISIAGDLGSIATAVLAIWIVRSVTRRQEGLRAVRPASDGVVPPRPDLPDRWLGSGL